MTENKAYSPNATCPGNFSCVNDNNGSSISPATGSSCFSNTTNKSADDSVKRGAQIKTTQITQINNALVDELARKRQTPKWQKSDVNPQPKEEVRFDNTMKRIKENLYRLTGYTLPVNAGDLMRASDIQTVYQKLNIAQDSCVCVGRCTCNARTSEIGCKCDMRCACDTQIGCGCNTRCACDTQIGCECNTRCKCDSEQGCACLQRCSCDSKSGCDCFKVCNCDSQGGCNCDSHCGSRAGVICTDNKCGCRSRCECDSDKVSSCPNRCGCDSDRDINCGSRCNCDTDTIVDCVSRCNCNAQADVSCVSRCNCASRKDIDCSARCNCDFRETVVCICNIRNVCDSFTAN